MYISLCGGELQASVLCDDRFDFSESKKIREGEDGLRVQDINILAFLHFLGFVGSAIVFCVLFAFIIYPKLFLYLAAIKGPLSKTDIMKFSARKTKDTKRWRRRRWQRYETT